MSSDSSASSPSIGGPLTVATADAAAASKSTKKKSTKKKSSKKSKRKAFACEQCSETTTYEKRSRAHKLGVCPSCFECDANTCRACRTPIDRANTCVEALDVEMCDSCCHDEMDAMDAEKEPVSEGQVEVFMLALEEADGDQDAALESIFITTANVVPTEAENIRTQRAFNEAVKRYEASL